MQVTRSTKLGIASVLFLAVAIGTLAIRGPISFLAAAVAWILGVMAALRGNKLWLIIPMVIIVGFGWMLLVATSHR